jgi:G3E family GTPase
MPIPRLILVGGFLGAGKTTLLTQAAERLARRGNRVGLVANDQAADLVDSEILRESGSRVEEVACGCFCCRFPDMIGAMDRLVREANVDVLIGEPVGSCTDLSATVIQPLKELHGSRFELSPFSVLIDVKQVRVLARLRTEVPSDAATRFPDNILYIFEKQLEEADLIVLNKIDMVSPIELAQVKALLVERFPNTPLLPMSAITGDGVGAWLDFVQHGRATGAKLVEVDYDTYAAGEAALGWLNASAKLEARDTIDWGRFAAELLETVRDELAAQSAEIAHLKLYLASTPGSIVGNLTSNEGPCLVRGEIAPDQRRAALLINARVHVEPDALRAAVENSLATTSKNRVETTITRIRCFFPGRPQPTYRYEEVVKTRNSTRVPRP